MQFSDIVPCGNLRFSIYVSDSGFLYDPTKPCCALPKSSPRYSLSESERVMPVAVALDEATTTPTSTNFTIPKLATCRDRDEIKDR